MKKHPTEMRDREADMECLANSFFEHLKLVSSKKSPISLWGVDPRMPMGAKGTELVDNILDVIGYLDEQDPCEACGAEHETSLKDDEAELYALDLWADLGEWMSNRWRDLHEQVAVRCEVCGCEVIPPDDEDGPFVCESCFEGETDEDNSEDDSDDAEDVCGECDRPVGDCDCEEDPEEEEEDEDLDEDFCAECGFALDDCDCEEEEDDL